MWGRGSIAACALGLSLAAPAAPALAAARSPTGAQIRGAVHRAAHSGALWATVNICDTGKYPHVIGIRGQMPALGFAAQLRMTFKIDYASGRRFKRLPGVAQPVTLGTQKRGIYQSGVRFTFAPHTGLLRGRVQFTWRLHGRTAGTVVRLTSGGHHGASYADPRGFSAARCSIV